jgi:hypothetical protein
MNPNELSFFSEIGQLLQAISLPLELFAKL